MSEARVVKIGTDKYTQVQCVDQPGPGGACHVYQIVSMFQGKPKNLLASIFFQNGPLKENVVNGIHHEDLLAIVLDRLEGFESGDYACSENATAIKSIENALFELRHRTDRRTEAGIEGTSQKDHIAGEAQEGVDSKIKCGGTPEYKKPTGEINKTDWMELDEFIEKHKGERIVVEGNTIRVIPVLDLDGRN